MAIIHVESDSLQELATVFLETIAEDFVQVARLLSGGLGAGTLVWHGLLLLLGGTISPALLRSLFELGSLLARHFRPER